MTKHDETVSKRRNFLKSAGGAALALLTTKRASSQTAPVKDSARRGSLHDQPYDAGLWVTWYDLPAANRDAYLSWLHGTYLPQILKRPGYLWAAHYATREDLVNPAASQLHHVDDPSVPTGFRFILLIATKDAFIFGNPIPTALHASLPEQDRKMLAMRVGERVNLLADAGRQEGRARKTYKDGLISAPCIQVGSFNCPVEYEEAMHAGYVQTRIPAMCATESSIRTRKLNSVAGWAKHVIIYEFASQEGFDRDYGPAGAKSQLMQGTRAITPMLIHAPHGPNSALRLWPPVKTA